MNAEHDRLHLTYRVRIGGEWEDVNETARIVRMPCRFGGARPYFVCPGVVNGTACGRRVAKLYGPGRYFLCRHCYRLAHSSQSEDAQRRSMRRATKIRQRLGGNAGTASPLPPKPKGMWQRTYERLREQAFDAEERADEALLPHLARLLAQTNKVLERLREELRERDYVPIVVNFDRPETKDFTETVRLLAGLSKFVIADLSSPKSAPYELGAIVSQTMIPFQPIIAEGETPFSMLQNLWINHPDRVFRPIHYSSPDALIAPLDEKIIRPAEARFVELLKRKADAMGGEHV